MDYFAINGLGCNAAIQVAYDGAGSMDIAEHHISVHDLNMKIFAMDCPKRSWAARSLVLFSRAVRVITFRGW